MESVDAARDAHSGLFAALDPRAGETVCIGVPHLDTAGWNFVESTLRMAAYDKAHGNHLLHNSGLMNNGALAAIWGRSVELSHARNTAAAAFLSSDADWLLWIDSDIGFEQDALERLMAVADPVTAPIVGGLAFIEGDYSHDFRGGLRSSLAPTLYDWTWIEPENGMPGAYKLLTRSDWPVDDVVRVSATGCGMLLTHRSVYEKISRWLGEQGAPPHIWFERIPGPDGELCGEDISFCMRAHQVGVPVLVHTGVATTHQKTVWYTSPDYHLKPFTPPKVRSQPLPPEQWPKLMINDRVVQDAAETSPIREKQVPEAEEEIAVLVPVAQRDNAAVFLISLQNSLTERQRRRVSVYVLADGDDRATAEAWNAQSDQYSGTVKIEMHHYLRTMGSFAEKINRGYQTSQEPWLFLVGDDVTFHKGWLDQAMEVARTTHARVIGTNDLGNPSVMAGTHATHMFIRRDYVDAIGASMDGPGVVCHEGYRHWYVDNEIIERARRRGEWMPCLASHVEHLHPLFSKGQIDDVYVIGQAAQETDLRLWMHRFQTMIENEGGE